MALTLAEKILAKAAGKDAVLPGDALDVRVDLFALGVGSVRSLPVAPAAPAAPERIAMLLDRHAPGDRKDAIARARELAAAHRLRAFVPPAEGGVLGVELLDRGLALPGAFVVGDDAALVAAGAVGALAFVLDDSNLSRALESGSIRTSVPRTLRVQIDGALGRWASGTDVGHKLRAQIPRELAAGAVIELSGPAIDRLEVVERLAAIAALQDLGARSILLVPDERALTWLRTRSAELIRTALPDAGARTDSLQVELDGLVPLVRPPGADEAARPVTALVETPIRCVRCGPGVGGRVEDLRLLARLLKDHAIHRDSELVVVPASRRHFLHAAEEGALATLLRAGALVASPVDDGAARFPEHDLMDGEFGFATTRPSGPSGRMFTGSVAVAAATASFGRLAHPDELLRQQREAV